MSGRPVPSQLDQVLPRFYVQKAGPYHPFGRIRIAPFGKEDLRILAESGILLSRTDLTGFILTEGAKMDAFDGKTLLAKNRLVPYDAFAIWMHYYRRRLTDTGGP